MLSVLEDNGERKILKSKRCIDIVFSLFILLVTAPFIIVALIAIKSEQILRGRWRDPLFYSETRISYGQPFTLYKINIFKYEKILAARVENKFIHTKTFEKNGGVTVTGWILEQVYMDELPQFFCVLKGSLSVVEPRPVNKEVHEMLIAQGHTDKLRVPAGITGYYQSTKGLAARPAQQLDKEYADYYHSMPWYKIVLFDLKIMLRTIKVILRAKGV